MKIVYLIKKLTEKATGNTRKAHEAHKNLYNIKYRAYTARSHSRMKRRQDRGEGRAAGPELEFGASWPGHTKRARRRLVPFGGVRRPGSLPSKVFRECGAGTALSKFPVAPAHSS